jgi:hypothetical protein
VFKKRHRGFLAGFLPPGCHALGQGDRQYHQHNTMAARAENPTSKRKGMVDGFLAMSSLTLRAATAKHY